MNIAPAPSSFPPPSWLPPPPSIHSKVASSSSHDPTPYSASAINGPYMGVVLVVLLITFFLMAAFSVYMRRYAFSLDRDPGPGTDRSGRGGRGRGLDRATIDGLPIVVYHCAKGEAAATQTHEWSRRPDCVVCLTDFQEAEKLRLLPRCEHCFHPECIDMWLFSHSTCPLCRRSLLPPPQPLPPPPPPAAGNNEVYITVQAPRPALVVPSDSTSAASSAPS